MSDLNQTIANLISGSQTDKVKAGYAMLGYAYDRIFEADKWRNALPYLQFPASYHVKIIPPFAAAVIRFLVRKDSTPGVERVSIYFDGYNNLGCPGQPYWEVYPGSDGDISRFMLGQETDMMEEIEKALQRLETKDEKEG